ncbi:hypothetical protein S83_032680 [Arachis hypogaea]
MVEMSLSLNPVFSLLIVHVFANNQHLKRTLLFRTIISCEGHNNLPEDLKLKPKINGYHLPPKTKIILYTYFCLKLKYLQLLKIKMNDYASFFLPFFFFCFFIYLVEVLKN